MHTQKDLEDAYKEHYSDLVTHALTVVRTLADAEDVVQDLALKIVQEPQQFEKAETLIAFYMTCITNSAITMYNRKKRTKPTEPGIMEYNRQKYMLEHQFDYDLAIDLDRILSTLTPDELRIIELKYYYGYLLKEIAEMIGTSENTVAQQLYRIRKKLEKAIGAEKLMLFLLLLSMGYFTK